MTAAREVKASNGSTRKANRAGSTPATSPKMFNFLKHEKMKDNHTTPEELAFEAKVLTNCVKALCFGLAGATTVVGFITGIDTAFPASALLAIAGACIEFHANPKEENK